MESYVTEELPQLLKQNFPVDLDKAGITGFSMGGHGSIGLFIKHPDKYKSCSAFAPGTDFTRTPFAADAFKAYFGDDYDQCHARYSVKDLVAACDRDVKIYVDFAEKDQYPEDIVESVLTECENPHVQLTIQIREGYLHDWGFVATFIEEHV